MYAENDEYGLSIVISGVLSPCLKTRFKSEQVQLTIVVVDEHLRDSLVQVFRYRVAHWKFKYRQLKSNVLDSRLTTADLASMLEWFKLIE